MVYDVDRSEPYWLGVSMLFGAWAASPYVGLATIGYIVRRRRDASAAVLIGMLAAAGLGMFAIYAAFFSDDAQSGLVFIGLPVLQWVVVGLTGATGALAGWLGRLTTTKGGG